MITRLSIAFEDLLGSSIAPQVMPHWRVLIALEIRLKKSYLLLPSSYLPWSTDQTRGQAAHCSADEQQKQKTVKRRMNYALHSDHNNPLPGFFKSSSSSCIRTRQSLSRSRHFLCSVFKIWEQGLWKIRCSRDLSFLKALSTRHIKLREGNWIQIVRHKEEHKGARGVIAPLSSDYKTALLNLLPFI